MRTPAITPGPAEARGLLASYDSVLARCVGNHAERSARYEQLLSEVHAVQARETKLLRNNERVDALAQAVRRIRSQCSEPYQRMRARVTQLDRMQQTAELLRGVQRLLYQCRKLHEGAAAALEGAAANSVASSADLPRVALSIHEVEEILAETDLTGIVLVDEQLPEHEPAIEVQLPV